MIYSYGNSLDLVADHQEYKIERWSSKEIVAASASPADTCHTRSVLKFDLVQKRVYWLQTVSEPVNQNLSELEKSTCSAIAKGMNLELKARTMWTKK